METGKYKFPAVTVDVAVFTVDRGRLQLLLVQRGKEPFKGEWALPGGFLDIEKDRTLEEGALRELKEETGITPPFICQLGAWGKIDRDPRGRVITVAYYATINRSAKEVTKAQDDAQSLLWFNINYNESRRLLLLKYHRKPVKLAFDHEDIVITAIERLREDIMKLPVVAPLLERQTFSISEIGEYYEIILGHPVNSGELLSQLRSQKLISALTSRLFYFNADAFKKLELRKR